MIARHNPFRTEKVLAVRYFIEPEELERILADWKRLGGRGAFVGPEGSGKTTLLEDVAHLLERAGTEIQWLQFRRDAVEACQDLAKASPTPVQPRHEAVLCIDGAEQLSVLQWQILKWRFRNNQGILITSHREGLLPTLRHCATSPEILARIIAKLSPTPNPHPAEIRSLYDRHHGNLREALRDLYDLYSQCER